MPASVPPTAPTLSNASVYLTNTPRKTRNSPTLSVDDQIATPEVHEEVFDGKRVNVMPAKENHAHNHAQLTYLLSSHIAPDYLCAVDMLTRIDEKNDLAPDISVYPQARDNHGHRQLERLAFEILDSSRKVKIGERAAKLAKRGVHRIFGIYVKKGEIYEWNSQEAQWQVLPHDFQIEDISLIRPIPVSSLLTTAKQEDEAAKALLLKKNSVLEQALQECEMKGKLEGKLESLRSSIRVLVHAFQIPFTLQHENVLQTSSYEELEALHTRVATTQKWNL